MKNLEDKVIWITGASSGIGEELALQLSAYNCKLILSARTLTLLEKVKSKCQANPDKIKVLPLDLSKSESLPGKVQQAQSFFGPIDILVNNGGVSQRSLANDTIMEVDRQIMEVNYFGAITLSKLLLPDMIARKSGHHVVISSVSGVLGTPMRSAYCASKHAVHGFYNALGAEMKENRIKVTIIAPGYIKTNISFHALKGDGSPQNKMDKGQANGIPVQVCVEQIIEAIRKEEPIRYIAGPKEKFGMFMFKFFPSIFRFLVTKMNTT